MQWVLSWLCLFLGWWEGEGVCACGGCRDRVRCAVGVDEDRVAYLLNDGAAARRLGGPARDAMDQRGGDVVGFYWVIGEDPERVFCVGLAGGFTVLDPVDGGEDDERVRTVEVDPEHAAGGAEAEDAAGDGEIAVVVGEDFVGDGEKVECGLGERFIAGLGIAPEGLWSCEVLCEEGAEAVVENELGFAAFGGRGAVLPEPPDVFFGLLFVFLNLRRRGLGWCRLRRRHLRGHLHGQGHRCQEQSGGGELEGAGGHGVSFSDSVSAG